MKQPKVKTYADGYFDGEKQKRDQILIIIREHREDALKRYEPFISLATHIDIIDWFIMEILKPKETGK